MKPYVIITTTTSANCMISMINSNYVQLINSNNQHQYQHVPTILCSWSMSSVMLVNFPIHTWHHGSVHQLDLQPGVPSLELPMSILIAKRHWERDKSLENSGEKPVRFVASTECLTTITDMKLKRLTEDNPSPLFSPDPVFNLWSLT